jgi:hypothetical protein
VPKTKTSTGSRFSAPAPLLAKLIGLVLLVVCAGLLIKLWLTLHRPTFLHSTNAGVITSQVYVGGKNPKQGPVVLTPTLRSPEPSDAADKPIRNSNINPE